VGFFTFPGADPTERTCNIPVGTALFFPIINTECSTVEDPPFHIDLDHPARCVDGRFNGETQSVSTEGLDLKIDGKQINLDWDDYFITSKVFDFSLPDVTPPNDHNNLGVLSNACTTNPDGCQAKSKGYWIMLPPLSKGDHTIAFSADRKQPDGTPKNPVNTLYRIQVVEGKKQ
jgi:hypothetical protein